MFARVGFLHDTKLIFKGKRTTSALLKLGLRLDLWIGILVGSLGSICVPVSITLKSMLSHARTPLVKVRKQLRDCINNGFFSIT